MTEDEDDDRVKTKLFKPLVSKPNKVMIAGVNVMFPLKPYSSQIAVMNAVSVYNRQYTFRLIS